MKDKERLADLLLAWEEQYEQDRDVPAEELCRDCPELTEVVRQRITALKRMKWLDKQTEEERPSASSPGKQNEEGFPCAARELPLRTGAEPVPGYRLVKQLGRGAFGEVWAAESRTKLVAMKFFHESVDTPLGRRRAEIEVEGVTRVRNVSHPRLLTVKRVRVIGQTLLVVTELADNSLENHFKDVLKDSPSQHRWASALRLLRDAAEACDFLQAKHNILHLDIKPANLLLVGDRCKIGDFGTVNRFREGRKPLPGVVLCTLSSENPDERRTENCCSWREVPWERAFCQGATLFTSEGVFTPYYAPPEAYSGKISRSFDQYSLALTLCELAAGTIPFSPQNGSQYTQRIHGTMDTGFLPEPLRPAIEKALLPQPEDRFKSCMEFVCAVQRALTPDIRDSVAAQRLLERSLAYESTARRKPPLSGMFFLSHLQTRLNAERKGRYYVASSSDSSPFSYIVNPAGQVLPHGYRDRAEADAFCSKLNRTWIDDEAKRPVS